MITIKEGCYYRRRDGEVVGPARIASGLALARSDGTGNASDELRAIIADLKAGAK